MATSTAEMDWIAFTPKPGFVVKSTALHAGFYYHNPSEFVLPDSNPSTLTASLSNQTEPQSRVAVPSNRKIFINVAYASEIPPPPIEDEAAVQRALLGQVQQEESHPEYFIPMLVGFGREDKDKAGNPTTVFDAFLNPTVRKRLTEDINYRTYVLEIILSTLESQPHPATSAKSSRSLSLSRTLATPNVRFKGGLVPRRVRKVELQVLAGPDTKLSSSVPSPGGSASRTITSNSVQPKKPLIEEISLSPNISSKQPPKSILKKTGLPNTQLNSDAEEDAHVKSASDAELLTPTWRWSLEKPGADVVISISIEIPDMSRSTLPQSKLSLSTDILTFRSPAYFLQIPLDSQNVKIPPSRIVDIDKAKAEWRIGDKLLVVSLVTMFIET